MLPVNTVCSFFSPPSSLLLAVSFFSLQSEQQTFSFSFSTQTRTQDLSCVNCSYRSVSILKQGNYRALTIASQTTDQIKTSSRVFSASLSISSHTFVFNCCVFFSTIFISFNRHLLHQPNEQIFVCLFFLNLSLLQQFPWNNSKKVSFMIRLMLVWLPFTQILLNYQNH